MKGGWVLGGEACVRTSPSCGGALAHCGDTRPCGAVSGSLSCVCVLGLRFHQSVPFLDTFSALFYYNLAPSSLQTWLYFLHDKVAPRSRSCKEPGWHRTQKCPRGGGRRWGRVRPRSGPHRRSECCTEIPGSHLGAVQSTGRGAGPARRTLPEPPLGPHPHHSVSVAPDHHPHLKLLISWKP